MKINIQGDSRSTIQFCFIGKQQFKALWTDEYSYTALQAIVKKSLLMCHNCNKTVHFRELRHKTIAVKKL